MKCHYCGKEVWLVRHLLDGDFCSPAHRRKYHERLRKSFEQLPKFEAAPAGIAGFNLRIPLSDPPSSHLPVGADFQSRWSGPYTPAALHLRLAPLAGESFLPLRAASFAGAPAAGLLAVAAEPVAKRGPEELAASLRAMPQPAMRSRLGLMEEARVELALVSVPQVRAAAPDLLPATQSLPAPQVSESLSASLSLMPRPVIRSRGGIMPRTEAAVALLAAPQARAMAPAPLPVTPAPAAQPASATLAVMPRPALHSMGGHMAEAAIGPAPLPARIVAPEPLPVSLVESPAPGLRLGTVWAPFEEPVFSPGVEETTPVRAPALGSWIRATVNPVTAATSAAPLPDALSPVSRIVSEMGRNGRLRPIGCRPPVFGQALLSTASLEPPEEAVLHAMPEPAAATVETHMSPALPGVVRPQPVRETAVLGKPMPLAGSISAASEVQPVAYAAQDTALPAFGLSPRPAKLSAGDVAAVSLAALAEGAAAVAGLEVPQISPAALRTPALPPLATLSAVLPEARATARVSPASVNPQPQAGVPSYQASLVLPGRTPAADAIAALANLPGMDLRLRAGHIPEAMPTPSAPRAARPFESCEPVAEEHTAAAAGLPEGRLTGASLTAAGPASLAPLPLSQPFRPVVPVPQFAAAGSACLGEVQAHTLETSIPPLADMVPLDVYMQRATMSRKRDCEPAEMPARSVLPAFALGTFPARLEQLVLQDWRRRFPSRPIVRGRAQGARVLSMPKRHALVGRLVQEAPQFVKAAAAVLVLGAILWMSWSAKSIRQAVTSDRHWLRQTIARRATLEIGDNFRSGLSLWDGRKSWVKSWSYDKDGFMRTGQLALYRPSSKLTNYRLEFFAQIDKKSMGWVFRAQDPQNYYAMKLTVTEPGPRPLVAVVHYPVVGGVKGKRVQTPLSVMMHNRTPYRVAVDVKGRRFRTFIEGQEVDEWTDDRLRAGGVGFFSEAGEQARLYWVKVSNNTDWLGRLCGLVAGEQGGENQAFNLGDPEGGSNGLLALSMDGILDGAKSVDQRRRGPVPVFGVFLWNLE